MSDVFGGGIYLTDSTDLNPQWDLDIDESGDIRTIFGEEELQKDVSYATTVRVGPEVGSHLRPVTLNRIKARVRAALTDEDRIESIRLIEVNEVEGNRVEVVTQANSGEDSVELVFMVN